MHAADMDNPEAAKRETLAERSKRIIGYSLDENLDPIEDAEHEHGTGKKSSKRREQVLNAQRNHRRRTQHYIQALEKEVLRLRKLETASQKRIEQLEIKNWKASQALEALASKNGSTPANLPTPNSMEQYPSAPGSVGSPEVATVDVNLDHVLNVEPTKGCSISSAFSLGNEYMDTPDAPMPVLKRDVSAIVKLDTQAAIDFVLELERPCRGHIKLAQVNDFDIPLAGKPVYFNTGPSHAFTASAYLMHNHRHPPGECHHQMPKADIEQLLEASLRLNLEYDYTPVQIWSLIVRRCKTGEMNGHMLDAITEEFTRYFRCDSFGSVVDKFKAEEILQQFNLFES